MEWWNGPSWLQCQQNWPPDFNTEPTVETENEVKKIHEILGFRLSQITKMTKFLKVFIM